MRLSNRDSSREDPVLPNARELSPLDWLDVLLPNDATTTEGVN
jgi:hypothetical protein